MDIEQAILDNLRALPPEKQQEVLDFTEFLQQRSVAKPPHTGLKGLWADLRVHISESDVTEARHEMWGNFPREDT